MFVVLRFAKPFFDTCQCTLSPLSLFILVGGLCPFADALRNPVRKPEAVQGGSGKDALSALHRERTLSKTEVSCSYCAVVLSSEATGIGHGWQEESRLDGSNELIWYGRL